MKNQEKFIIAIAALVGLVVSAVLLRHHVDSSYSSLLIDTFCGSSQKSGCNLINRSSASVIIIPVSLWGIYFYMLSLGMLFLDKWIRSIDILKLVFLFSALAFIADLALLIYSVAAFGTVCTLCSITYLATFVMVIFGYLALKKSDKGFFPEFTFLINGTVPAFVPVVLLTLFVFLSGGLLWSAFSKGAENSGGGYERHLQIAINKFIQDYKRTQPISFRIQSQARKGPERAILNIVKFADFMCPACRAANAELEELTKKYPDLVSLTYRHYPLEPVCNSSVQMEHKGSCMLSYASYCAMQQGRFWDMHHAIFDNQQTLAGDGSVTEDEMLVMARKVGLNTGELTRCMSTPAAKENIAADIAEGNEIGITGTPAIFINGRPVREFRTFLLENLLIELYRESQRR